MDNLRIINVQVIDSSNIDVTFTDNLVHNLTTSNVSIVSELENIPNSQVLGISINQATLSINCQPLSQFVSYNLVFQSTPLNPFISINGTARLSEDGVSNQYLILGPMEPDNPIQDFFTSFFKDNIYDLSDNTLVSQYLKSASTNLARALYDIRQTKNENYLSFAVGDEQHTRGNGPTDRLNNESAYEVSRVGRTVSGTNVNISITLDDFPNYPITLQQQNNSETLTPNSIDEVGSFNINTLTLNLNNFPVTKAISIIFTFTTANPIYTYDIETLGYQIENSRYDQDFGFSYGLLKNNQIRINEIVLNDSNFDLDNLLRVDVVYQNKNLGIVVDTNNTIVYTVLTSIREVLPPIINVFNLKHAPIVDSNNNILTLGGLNLTDPNNPGGKHPAFLFEIPFRLNGLPSIPGQYCVDYSTSTVYVYGSDLNNDGTGPFPPLATYNYRFVYKIDQDYALDPDSLDLVALPKGNLINSTGVINFNYEQVLIPGIDYKAELHIESLNERINNNLLALNSLKVQNSPITNVFKIYNETSGEIYTLNRWNNDRVYFRYTNPPRLIQEIGENVTFNNITNELLFVNNTINNGIRIFKILLQNNSLTAGTQDSIGSFINSNIGFSNSNVFINEKWFNRDLDEVTNISRISVGQYMIDYTNGIVYVGVSNTQDFNIGTISYKNNIIVPNNSHLISVDDIYYRISVLNPKNKDFSYTSFGEGSILPEDLDYSDELYLNKVSSSPYQVLNGNIGAFVSGSFVNGVTNQIKFIRSIFEYQDLLNSTNPLNFGTFATFNGFNININSINKQKVDTVLFDGTNHYVNVDENISYFSGNITYTFSVIRISDGLSLYSGNVIPGNPVKLILDIHSPNLGDTVNIIYTFSIDDLSRLVIDYNKGDFFIDYTYLADEILVSYEYGDNVLDFRQGKNLSPGDTYYVSYKVGALRDALLRNFGTLVNIPILANVDLDFDRERYRDALSAALTSFIQGPTVSAIKNIGKTISHIEPEIVESIFNNWSLGNSLLNPESISTAGTFQLLPGKFGNGVLINSPDQKVTLPLNSNLRLEEGTFETWIIPQWNGLDNDSKLTFNIKNNNFSIDTNKVFIGPAEYHPNSVNFTLDKNDNVLGTPNKNKDGIFIYYDKDISGNFNRWYVEVIDGYTHTSSNYQIKITSNGNFYDSKTLNIPKPSNLSITTGLNSLTYNITGGGIFDLLLTFIADNEHYLLDCGNGNKNRLSIFKDPSGYLNFRIFDKDKVVFNISADVSSWKNGDLHHVGASWKFNSVDFRDEMHLFLDGEEVPNIIKYGQKLTPYLHEKFRTVDPEEIIGLVNRDIVGSDDLVTIMGSAVVTSSINFSNYNIFPGDTIFIDEIGFSTLGYNILSINGQSLILNSVLPLTLNNGRFSVNRTQFTVVSDIDTASNIAVSVIHDFVSGTDMSGSMNSSVVNSSLDFNTLNVQPGYLLRIDNGSLKIVYTILQVLGNNLVIDDILPVNISSNVFRVYSNTETEIPGLRAVFPAYSISKDINFNNILTISNDIKAGDLILIKTLGLNHKRIRRTYYVWSNGVENVIRTKLPPPISLDETNIYKNLLTNTVIGPNNSSIIGGVFNSNNINTSQPSNTITGRTISVTLSGTNIDFSTSPTITINGLSNSVSTTETITFTDTGTLDFIHSFNQINYVKANIKPINITKNAGIINVSEKYPITLSEFNGISPIIRYSYFMGGGYTLFNDSISSVRDNNNIFSYLDINNYLVINSTSWIGTYLITGLSVDRKSLYISPINGNTLPSGSFTNGYYQILNATSYRSGLQDGYFTFEVNDLPGQPYYLNSGFYEFDYSTYSRININPSGPVFIGSDSNGKHHIDGIVDQLKIYSIMLSDTRIGETIPDTQKSITKDFNSLKALTADSMTLVLSSFDVFPFTNDADFYIKPSPVKNHFQSSNVVNDNFGNSLVFLKEPLIVSNDGILNTQKEGTIEFWMNPLFDTGNDPNLRYYFDAYGAIVEEAVSINDVSVKLSNPASQILSVILQSGDPTIDYFAGGKLEIDTQRAIQEEVISLTISTVIVSQLILQVSTVKIVGDLTETDYFANGNIGTDKKTIYLGKTLPGIVPLIITYQTSNGNNNVLNTQVIRLNKKLPYQQSKVLVNYIPKGLQGDRISIFKDLFGYMNFQITASNIDYVVRAPSRWVRGTWHRIKASYKINGGIVNDELRLFLDGYEYNDVKFGSGIVFGGFPFVMGSSAPGGDGYDTFSIQFKDPINDLVIGSQYNKQYPAFSLIDNLRISNISRPIYAPFGEPLDVNYTSNIDMAFPVTQDLYTTYLLDFDSSLILNDDFAVLVNRETGIFDFSINILDSFDIVLDNIKSQEALEALLKTLKPASSRMALSYIR